MTILLDSNVLVALVVADHVHHDPAETWFAETEGRFATCPITQGALIRLMVRYGGTAEEACRVLTSLTDVESHVFWPDDLGYGKVPMTGVVGHRQVTDAYLAALAHHRQGRLATFDQGLAALHPDVAALVPSG